MKVLRAPRMERCIGCHSCSLACARLVHKKLSWSMAGIRIHSAGGMTTGFEAKLCLACKRAACVRACPTGALTQRRGGGVKLDKSLCMRCGYCARACPVEAIHISSATGEPYVCIQCGQCVRYCPHECLEMVEVDATQTALPGDNEPDEGGSSAGPDRAEGQEGDQEGSHGR